MKRKVFALRKAYPAVDAAKLVMALFVVGIHRSLFADRTLDHMTVNVLFSIAVPFFFVTSSFLLFRKLQSPEQDRRKTFLRFEKRILILYIVYTIVYLPCIFVKSFTGHYDEITLRALAGECLFLVRRFFLDTSYIHMWYLHTLMISMLIVYLLTIKVHGRWLIAGVGATSLCGIIALEMALPQIADMLTEAVRRTLMTGIPCVCAGYFAAQTDDETTRTEKIIYPILFVLFLGCGALTLDNKALWLKGIFKVLTFVSAFGVLRLCVGSTLQPHPAYAVMRKYSTLIYFLHLLLMNEGLNWLAAHTGIASLTEAGILSYSLTLFLAVIEATCILLLQKKKGFHWLRVMY